jgi:hypothetical protein
MSSIANCHNPATSAQLSESDHDDENEYDSSCNRQNEVCFWVFKGWIYLIVISFLDYDA